MAEVRSVSLSEISEPWWDSVLGVFMEEKSSACRELPALASTKLQLLLFLWISWEVIILVFVFHSSS